MIANSYVAAEIAAARSRDRLEAAHMARLAAQARPRRKQPVLRRSLALHRRPVAEPRPTR